MTQAEPVSHFYQSQRLRLHYLDWGNPDAPPLLMVHGGRDHARNWDWSVAALRDDWHVITPDLRGHGDSEWVSDGNYSANMMMFDLGELIDQLGFDTVRLVGHSLGGNVCVRYTGLYPARVVKLVSIEGLGLTPHRIAQQSEIPYEDRLREWVDKKRATSTRVPHRYRSIDDALARMREENPQLSEEQARHLTIHGLRANGDGSWSWKFDNHLHVWPVQESAQAEVESLWEAITCPVLMYHGANSWISSPAKDGRAAYFRDAQVVEVADAGHWLHHDQFDVYMAALKAFI